MDPMGLKPFARCWEKFTLVDNSSRFRTHIYFDIKIEHYDWTYQSQYIFLLEKKQFYPTRDEMQSFVATKHGFAWTLPLQRFLVYTSPYDLWLPLHVSRLNKPIILCWTQLWKSSPSKFKVREIPKVEIPLKIPSQMISWMWKSTYMERELYILQGCKQFVEQNMFQAGYLSPTAYLKQSPCYLQYNCWWLKPHNT